MKSIESYLPHSGEMVLIDEIVEVGSDFVITKMLTKNHSAFCDKTNGDSSVFFTHKSIELMAQSLGIFRKCNSNDSSSDKNKLGFLLGTRRFKIFKPYIKECAIIKAMLSMQDSSGASVWDCEIIEDNALVASATLSVLNPSDEFIQLIMLQ